MQRLTTDEQLEQIWNAAIEAGIAPIRTMGSNGDPFTIFDDWDNVSRVAEIIRQVLPADVLEQAPNWLHLPEDRRPDPDHHLEWAIGEFGFTDQYSTCSNCYMAIDETDYNPDHWRHSATGEITCGDCLRGEKSWGDDYLTDMAYQLREDGDSIIKRLANPSDHGFVCINGESSKYYGDSESEIHLTDHPDYDSRLTYADRDWLQRLGKAAELIDPRLQIVYAYLGGSNRIWARFNPNENVEFIIYNEHGWGTFTESEDNQTLGYAISRVIAKWVVLQDKGHWA